MEESKSKYKYWLGKGGPLRHYFQHLCIGIVGLIFSVLFFGNLNWTSTLLFFIGTFLIDLDALLSGFFYINQFPYLKKAKEHFLKGNFTDFMRELAINHKLFDKLILHNVVGFIFVLSLFVYFFSERSTSLFFLTSGIIVHFIFDIFDDYYQLGHIRNWLRPRFLFKGFN